MDKDKLFDKIKSEKEHYCKFICGRCVICNDNDLDDEEIVCDICQVDEFVEFLEREIQVDKLD